MQLIRILPQFKINNATEYFPASGTLTVHVKESSLVVQLETQNRAACPGHCSFRPPLRLASPLMSTVRFAGSIGKTLTAASVRAACC